MHIGSIRYFLLTGLLAMAVSHTGCERISEDGSGPALEGGPHSEVPGEAAGSQAAATVMQRINAYKERLKKDPKDLEALIALGNANFDIQRFDKARDLYQRALDINPHDATVRSDLASCYRNLGDVEAAYRELENVLALSPTNETALYNIGVIRLNDRNDKKGAIEAWEKLIATHPDVSYAEELKQRIEELKAAPDS